MQNGFLVPGELVPVLGITDRQLQRWINAGYVRPVIRGRGKGTRHVFALVPDVLALATGRDLRRRGLSLPQAGAAMRAILRFGADGLQRAFDSGRSMFVMVGSDPAPSLVSRQDMPTIAAAIGAKNLTAVLVVVDLASVLAQLRERLAATEPAPETAPETAAETAALDKVTT